MKKYLKNILLRVRWCLKFSALQATDLKKNSFPLKKTKMYLVQVAFLGLSASTVHFVIDEFPSNPGVNWSTTEKGSMLETASLKKINKM